MEFTKALHLLLRRQELQLFKNSPMFFTNTNYFKTTFLALALFVLAFAGTGCERENLLADQSQPTLQGLGGNGVQRPATQCAPSAFVPLKNGSTTLGNVEILNFEDDLYLIFTLNTFKFLDEMRIYAGNLANVPVNADGLLELEEFPVRQVVETPTNSYTMVLKLDAVPQCYDIFVWTRISTRNMFGHVTQVQEAWMTGNSIMDGAYASYCAANCVTSAGNNISAQ